MVGKINELTRHIMAENCRFLNTEQLHPNPCTNKLNQTWVWLLGAQGMSLGGPQPLPERGNSVSHQNACLRELNYQQEKLLFVVANTWGYVPDLFFSEHLLKSAHSYAYEVPTTQSMSPKNLGTMPLKRNHQEGYSLCLPVSVED